MDGLMAWFMMLATMIIGNGLEVAAVLLGIANIILLVRRNIWNFPVGMLMVLLYFEIFREARLYSDMLLQIFFLIVQAWGWIAWHRAGGMDGPIAVQRLSNAERAAWVGGTIIATVIWGWGMHRYTDAAAPWWDAAVAMGSIAAQILLTRRAIENWIGWIIVDAFAISLYANRGLGLTAGLYVLFLILSIAGLAQWLKAEQEAKRAAGQPFR
jgi:nicotinamide mononucleotide transporter